MIIKDMPVCERPREKMLQYGPEALSNAELIASIIGSGSRKRSAMDLAQELLKSGGLGFLGSCRMEEILSIDGLGNAKSCQLMAAVELGKRLSGLPLRERTYFEDQEAVASYFMSTMRYLPEEHFRILLLDTHGGMISVEEVGMGGLMGVEIHPREVFSVAVRKQAAAFVAAHNHPSGDPSPSMEDRRLTERLGSAGEIIGIPLLDHMIIGDGRYENIPYRKEIETLEEKDE